jgi:zinc protease
MKKFFTTLAMSLVLGSSALVAQQIQPLPMDPSVRYGKLPNGLTYYIRHNDLPEHHAEFFIAQKVGSVLEEESQRGLAHFLEHMAFNGTKNYPDKGLLEYLQRHGVKFGTNVNAYTSIDETVYNISDVPIDEALHPGIVDSCLLILHDWSGYLTLDGDEIDKERGVIHEEWRTRTSAALRMYDTILPKLIPGNRYAERMPIGLMSVVDNFSYDELRNYYHKWYRPDLQGIFVVGDVDVDAVEQKIQTLWSDIHMPENPAERVYYKVEDNVEPLVAVASDPEQNYNLLSVMYKSDPLPDELKLSQIGYMTSILENIITKALDQRLSELTEKADAPFLQAGTGIGDYIVCKTKECFELDVIFRENEWQKGLNAAMAVVLSAAKYGFNDSEIERVKADIMSGMENAYNERDKRKNRPIVSEIQRNFLDAEPMPGIEMEWQMIQQILPMLNAQMINQVMAQVITPNNVALMVMGQQKEGNVLPTEEQLLAAYKESLNQEVTAYEEALSGIELMPNLPANAGKVVKEEAGDWGSTVWTLSNGVTVVFKQTDFKKDQVLMNAYSKGGTRLDMSQPNIVRQTVEDLATVGGVGQFSNTDLPKVLAGKNASVGLSVDARSEGLSGTAAPKDLRTLFELVYLNMTDLRYDEEAYQAWFNRQKTQLEMIQDNPQKIMSDSLQYTLYPGLPDMVPTQLEDLALIDYKKGYELGKQRFANAADFTFYFVGNVDVDSLRTMSEQYLAALPASKEREQRPDAVLPVAGSRENRFDLPMQQAKTSVYDLFYVYDTPYTLKNGLVANMLGQSVSIIFTETIREEEGAVYSPHAQASMDSSTGLLTLLYLFDTGADKRENAENVAYREIKRIADEGVREDVFQKVHDYMAKSHQEQVKENAYWLSNLQMKREFGINTVDNWEETFNSITADDVKALLNRFLSPEATRIQFVANGVEVEK